MEKLEAGQIIFDEASDITPKMIRFGARLYRKGRAKSGWPNWYINRGRMALTPTKSELRRMSWRRAH